MKLRNIAAAITATAAATGLLYAVVRYAQGKCGQQTTVRPTSKGDLTFGMTRLNGGNDGILVVLPESVKASDPWLLTQTRADLQQHIHSSLKATSVGNYDPIDGKEATLLISSDQPGTDLASKLEQIADRVHFVVEARIQVISATTAR